jgi:hypothetical protein
MATGDIRKSGDVSGQKAWKEILTTDGKVAFVDAVGISGPVTVSGPVSLANDPAAPTPVYTPGGLFTAAVAFNRPADTAAYLAGDRVADSTSAATVLEFTNVARAIGEAVRIERVRLRKTGPSLTNASFRVHLFRLQPTVNVNDNGIFNASNVLALADINGYVGSVDITMDKAAVIGARGVGVPTAGTGITAEAAGQASHTLSLWAVIEALAAYTPVSGETFTLTLEGLRS